MEKSSNRKETNTIVILLSVLVLVILAVLGAVNSNLIVDKLFDTTGFYGGSSFIKTDPKKLYDSMYSNNVLLANKCRQNMIEAQVSTGYINGRTWIVDGQEAPSDSDLQSKYPDLKVEGLYQNGQYIVAPGFCTFLNKNTSVKATSGETYIEVLCGTDYRIEWSNIKCWWCHIGRSNSNKHTDTYGEGTLYSTCQERWVLGEATQDTYVTFWQKDDNDNWHQITIAEFYEIS